MTLSPLKGSSAIALIDCNNFYVSCEQAFDPKLKVKPVVVLSNNDGCIISRNQAAKKIVSMGAPLFQNEKILTENNAEILSSNYELYGDMSRRVTETLETFTPDIEKYSIDESFLEIQETRKSFEYLGQEIRDKVYKWTNIPVGVGFGETKTLAKIANRIAKHSAKAQSVVNLYKSPHVDIALERTPVEHIWGIGKQTAKKLQDYGITSALQFKYQPQRWVRKNFTVVGSRTLLEINGIRCLPLELTPPPKKSITCTRSFSEIIDSAPILYNAISAFLMKAVSKLREHKMAAKSLTVFAQTNRFHDDFSKNIYTYNSAYPSDNIFELQSWAGKCFENIFAANLQYKKAGVILEGLISRESITSRMFKEEHLAPKLEKLNRAIDEINLKFGRDTIRLAAAHAGQWQSKSERMSPRYTTRIDEVIKIK